MLLCCDAQYVRSYRCPLQWCNGKCIPNQLECNRTNENLQFLEDRCITEIDAGYWECNGQLQSLSMPCHGICHGSGTKEHFDLFAKTGVTFDEHFYWKCPNDGKCIPLGTLCSKEMIKIDGLKKSCSNDIQNSREICDHPEKYEFNLDCSARGLLQCPGNKTQQCINEWKVCDGKFDCTDR